MLVPSAEDSYRTGLAALDAGRKREALALFEAAIEIEGRYSRARPQPRYISYYGMCLALDTSSVREGLQLCREAVTLEGYDADLRCNLGRVLLRAGRRREAYRAFLRGLELHAGHGPSLRALKLMGVRRRPLVPFLSRRNPLNVILGRLRA